LILELFYVLRLWDLYLLSFQMCESCDGAEMQ